MENPDDYGQFDMALLHFHKGPLSYYKLNLSKPFLIIFFTLPELKARQEFEFDFDK